MRQLYIILILLLISGRVSAKGFIVRNFTADFYLSSEGYFDVVEKYDIHFTEPKHGIFREIVLDYQLDAVDDEGQSRKIVVRNLKVPGHKWDKSSRFSQRMQGKIVIKIGDQDRLVSGSQQYEIRYRVYNAFLFDDDYVQFYWNIKPQGWLAIFEKVKFTIHAPDGTIMSPDNCFVYAGPAGTATPSTDFDYTYTDGVFAVESQRSFITLPGQNVTALVKLPRDAIKEYFIIKPIWQIYSWIAILLILLSSFWLIWWKFGRDDKIVSTTSYYPPEGIDPAMAGYLMDDKDDVADLLALIPQWASQGLITVEEIPKKGLLGKADMKLTRLDKLPPSSPSYQRRIFDALFGRSGNMVLISTLRNTFYMPMNEAKKDLKDAAQEYYDPRSRFIMKITLVVAILLGVLLTFVFLSIYSILAAVCAALTFIFIALMSFFLQKKNDQGNVIFAELKGFKRFIRMAELERIKVLIEDDPYYFEKTMSYALAFGLLDRWAKKFDALDIPPPSWYTSSGARLNGMSTFTRSFSGNMTRAQSHMVSSPSKSRSGGGGSSGGGFGGGGGGSW